MDDERLNGVGGAGDPAAVRPGQVWELGEHRVACGDCRDQAVVSALMDGETASLMLCDPPYGVRYTGSGTKRQPIRNDDLTTDRLWALLAGAFTTAPLRPGSACYIHAPSGKTVQAFYGAAEQAGLDIRQSLVWLKNHFVLSRGDYHNKHEMILYGWKKGGPHYYGGGRKQHSVWEFAKPLRSPLHPTAKPVDLLKRAILNSSLPGEVVFDGFGGSGSTLIACEQTGRRCRTVEIEPGYCSTIIERWEQATGGVARLVGISAI